MAKDPSVAILTATYNQEQYIRECIDSVLAQTYPYWHLFILNDGSTDATSQIAHEYATRDSRITVIDFEHEGMLTLAKRYNAALAQSNDDFVAILDGDDFWPPNKLQIQVGTHSKSGVALSFGNVLEIAGPHKTEMFSADTRTFLKCADPYTTLIPYLEAQFSVPAVSVMVRESSLDEIGGFHQPSYLPLCDYPTWLLLGTKGMMYIDHILGYWRHNPNQTTWVQARQTAYGMFKYEREFVEQQQLPVDLFSKSRTRYLADASYRSAVLSWKSGNTQEAYEALKELFMFRRFQNIDMLFKFFLVVAWNTLRSTQHSASSERQS
ncbi:hypothetical protein BXT84_10795 [Sulfobacillus thermotolerans]|uniref:Glycosyltransferase 2-like domain-containing protein n=1 Tax=Sulfobacillus thermotolerans TaxID=338644 RepID=A0ABN5H1Z0_9FIRM|nr:hypothetical protein BXT84_10795 [Sulfobacillus thermotolerans]